MTAIEAAKVVRDAAKVIQDGVRLICERDCILAHIKSINWEVNVSVILLLTRNLSINMAEHATSPRASTTSLLEPLQLDDENLGHRVELKLLSDISVLSADVAVPLVIS